MVSNFKKLLADIHTSDLKEQKIRLEKELGEWKKETEQTDDILVLGFQV